MNTNINRRSWATVVIVMLAIMIAVPATGQRAKRRSNSKKGAVTGISTDYIVDLGLSVKWAGYNVGASSPEQYGYLIGWADVTGEKTSCDPDDYPNSNPPASICGNYHYDMATAMWGHPWRLPTLAEMKELISRCTWRWCTYKGVKGYKVTGPSGKSIFMPSSGHRYGTSALNRGKEGYYWTGELATDFPEYAFFLIFSSSVQTTDFYRCSRYYGLSVRAVRK